MVAFVHVQLQKSLGVRAFPTWLPTLIKLTQWKEIAVVLQGFSFFKGKQPLLPNLLSESVRRLLQKFSNANSVNSTLDK